VPSADKRQRKKDNARAAREAREAAEKRRKQFKMARNVGIIVALFVIIIVISNVVSGGGGKKKSSTPPTTAAKTGVTVSPAAVSAVKCVDTKPPASTKPTNLKAPAMTIDPNKTYTATMSTSCGDIVIALDAKNAPKGVNNFVSLAKQGFYDGLTFHRVVTDFAIQGGDPKGDGTGSPGYSEVTELPKNGYPLGELAWAKTQNDPAGSAGSQFFIVTQDHAQALDDTSTGGYQYGAFGQVTKGIEVAKKMEGFDDKSQANKPTRPLYIFKVTITES
jgi:cyclophilin family peptidyl-prolyl cis-trans isomerase